MSGFESEDIEIWSLREEHEEILILRGDDEISRLDGEDSYVALIQKIEKITNLSFGREIWILHFVSPIVGNMRKRKI